MPAPPARPPIDAACRGPAPDDEIGLDDAWVPDGAVLVARVDVVSTADVVVVAIVRLPYGVMGEVEVADTEPVDKYGVEIVPLLYGKYPVEVALATGHTVVETAMTEVTTAVDEAGQFFTVEAQLMTV